MPRVQSACVRRRRINWNLQSLGEDAGMVEVVLFGGASLIPRRHRSRARAEQPAEEYVREYLEEHEDSDLDFFSWASLNYMRK